MKNCESPRKTLVACIGDAQSALQGSFMSQKKHEVNQVLLVSDEPAVANRVSGHYVIAETEVRISYSKALWYISLLPSLTRTPTSCFCFLCIHTRRNSLPFDYIHTYTFFH